MTSSAVPAFVQAIGVIVAALVSIYFWRHRVTAEKEIERNADLRRRADRVSDLLVALRAEIMIEAEPLARQFDPNVIADTRNTFVSRLRDDRPKLDKKDMPQAPAAGPMFVFDQLKAELDQLPAEVIEEVVRYYKYDQRLTGLIQAFSVGMYQELSDDRQTQAIDALMELGLKTLRAAFIARKAIDTYLTTRHPARPWSASDNALASRLDENDDGTAHRPPRDPDPNIT